MAFALNHTVLFSLVLLAFVELSYAVFPIVIKLGKCPTVNAQSTLDKARYLGVWHEYQRFPAIFEAGLDCTTATYGSISDGVSVTNKGYNRVNFFGNYIVLGKNEVDGKATVPNAAKPAELSVSFGGSPSSDSANYFIVDTDYDNYSVVFSCTDLIGFNIQFAWILTRAAGTAPSNLAALRSNLDGLGVDISLFNTISQEKCP